jgi:hypothetical protein
MFLSESSFSALLKLYILLQRKLSQRNYITASCMQIEHCFNDTRLFNVSIKNLFVTEGISQRDRAESWIDIKGIVSWDWGGLLIVLLDRYCTIDMAGKYLFLFSKPSSYLKFNIFMPLRRDVPGSKVTWPVLPNKKFSARSTKMVEEN